MDEREHYHAEVLENGRFTERRKCFNEGTSPDPRGAVIYWIGQEVTSDKAYKGVDQEFDRIMDSLTEFGKDDTPDSWEESLMVPWGDKEIKTGYRIMFIDGACLEDGVS